ncbi:MAG: hydroxyacylglutathione hydrolase [Gammaproteobacteria bacterium]|nr:MAG: hydroxyacylglutathione hydrolase [Gammaproteobacteria bacterium]
MIFPIPAFQDNYIWCWPSPAGLWVVDPGDAAAVERLASKLNHAVAGILVTHHHPDHTAGIAKLAEKWSPEIIGSQDSRFTGLTHTVAPEETVEAGGLSLKMLPVPGHTLDHVAWFGHTPEYPVLFCGDTLFSGGCGRLFEGSAEQMAASLLRLMELPDETRIFPAHEYTLANYRFAARCFPEDPAIQARLEEVESTLARGAPTLPVTLAEEKRANVFLRALADPALQAAIQQKTETPLKHPADFFATIRAWKDAA